MNDTLYYIQLTGLTTVSFGYFFIAVISYLKNRSKLLNQVLALMATFLGLWIFSITFSLVNTNPAWLPFFAKLPSSFGSFAAFFVIYFAAVYPRNTDLRPWIKYVFLAPAVFFSLAWPFTDLLIAGFHEINPQNLYLSPPLYGPLNPLYVIYASLYLLGAFFILLNKYIRSKDRQERKLILSMLLVAISGIPIVLVVSLWLPQFGFFDLNLLSPNILLVSVGICAYIVLNFDVFKITPKVAAPEILSALSSELAVFDLKGKAVYENELSAFFPQEKIVDIINEVVSHGSLNDQRFAIQGKNLMVSARFLQEGGGVIMISHEITDVEEAADEEKLAYQSLNSKLQKESQVREALTKISAAPDLSALNSISKEFEQNLKSEPESLLIISSLHEKAIDKFRLLSEIEKDKTDLEKGLIEEERINKINIERELEMIEIKKKIFKIT